MRFDYDTAGRGRTYTGNTLQSDLGAGLANIGELMRNPGQLSSGISSAIAPRLAMESEDIAGNFRNIRSNQAGMAARTNAPVSIKNALGSALDVAQFRAQRDARRTAQLDSETLRRGDLENTYRILATILDYINGGRGIAAGAQANAQQQAGQRQAATVGALGNFASSLAQYGQNSGGGGG